MNAPVIVLNRLGRAGSAGAGTDADAATGRGGSANRFVPDGAGRRAVECADTGPPAPNVCTVANTLCPGVPTAAGALTP